MPHVQDVTDSCDVCEYNRILFEPLPLPGPHDHCPSLQDLCCRFISRRYEDLNISDLPNGALERLKWHLCIDALMVYCDVFERACVDLDKVWKKHVFKLYNFGGLCSTETDSFALETLTKGGFGVDHKASQPKQVFLRRYCNRLLYEITRAKSTVIACKCYSKLQQYLSHTRSISVRWHCFTDLAHEYLLPVFNSLRTSIIALTIERLQITSGNFENGMHLLQSLKDQGMLKSLAFLEIGNNALTLHYWQKLLEFLTNWDNKWYHWTDLDEKLKGAEIYIESHCNADSVSGQRNPAAVVFNGSVKTRPVNKELFFATRFQNDDVHNIFGGHGWASANYSINSLMEHNGTAANGSFENDAIDESSTDLYDVALSRCSGFVADGYSDTVFAALKIITSFHDQNLLNNCHESVNNMDLVLTGLEALSLPLPKVESALEEQLCEHLRKLLLCGPTFRRLELKMNGQWNGCMKYILVKVGCCHLTHLYISFHEPTVSQCINQVLKVLLEVYSTYSDLVPMKYVGFSDVTCEWTEIDLSGYTKNVRAVQQLELFYVTLDMVSERNVMHFLRCNSSVFTNLTFWNLNEHLLQHNHLFELCVLETVCISGSELQTIKLAGEFKHANEEICDNFEAAFIAVLETCKMLKLVLLSDTPLRSTFVARPDFITAVRTHRNLKYLSLVGVDLGYNFGEFMVSLLTCTNGMPIALRSLDLGNCTIPKDQLFSMASYISQAKNQHKLHHLGIGLNNLTANEQEALRTLLHCVAEHVLL